MGQPLLIACVGIGNFISVRGSGAQERTATCVSGQQFLVDDIQYHAVTDKDQP